MQAIWRHSKNLPSWNSGTAWNSNAGNHRPHTPQLEFLWIGFQPGLMDAVSNHSWS
jgi:hypothetical protein